MEVNAVQLKMALSVCVRLNVRLERRRPVLVELNKALFTVNITHKQKKMHTSSTIIVPMQYPIALEPGHSTLLHWHN